MEFLFLILNMKYNQLEKILYSVELNLDKYYCLYRLAIIFRYEFLYIFFQFNKLYRLQFSKHSFFFVGLKSINDLTFDANKRPFKITVKNLLGKKNHPCPGGPI